MWKKSGAWFYKGIPNYELPQRSQTTIPTQQMINEAPPRVIRTTKLGMELEDSSDETDDTEKLTEFSNGRLNDCTKLTSINSQNSRNTRNLYNLKLSTGNSFSSKVSMDDSVLNKRSPNTPYSRQTSSSESQKSAHSMLPPNNDYETHTKPRRSSISSCWSISESSGTESTMAVNKSNFATYQQLKDLIKTMFSYSF